MLVDEDENGNWGWECPLSSEYHRGFVTCVDGVSFLVPPFIDAPTCSFRGSQLQHCGIPIQPWHLAGCWNSFATHRPQPSEGGHSLGR